MAEHLFSDARLDPHDRLFAAIIRQALIDARGTSPHTLEARTFLLGSGLLERAGICTEEDGEHETPDGAPEDQTLEAQQAPRQSDAGCRAAPRQGVRGGAGAR